MLIETQSGRTIKVIRTDNGMKFLSREFKDLFAEGGILRHMTVPSNPQQNGLAERFSRTFLEFLEIIQCMFIDANLPKTFWTEAFITTTYLINMRPSTTLNFKTTREIWSGKLHDYNMLTTLCCLAYVHTRQ